MDAGIYEISFKRLVTWLVPEVLRRQRMMALLNALVTPVANIHNAFITNRRNNLYKLLITPQVCYVEMALNDKYDPTGRRISIVSPKSYDPLFIYRRVEAKPVYLDRKNAVTNNDKIWLYQKGEVNSFQFDFIIKLPSGMVVNKDEMRAVVDSYILPEKTYTID